MKTHYLRLFFAAPFLALPQGAEAQSPKTDFEITFLADNFAAFRLPPTTTDRVLKAGDLVSPKTFEVQSGLQRCVDGAWDQFYFRDDASFELRSRSSSRSGRLEAEVASLFDLRGQVIIATSSSITDERSLVVQADAARVERLWANDDIRSDESRCDPYLQYYSNNYLPSDNLLIQNAYFLSGDMFHMYSISLEGSGSGSISSSQLTEFLDTVPFLSGLSNLFSLDASLEVGGESADSDDIRYDYGALSSFPIGFRPAAVQRENVDQTLDAVDELPSGEASLIEATNGAEEARAFLNEFPNFDLQNPEAVVARVFVGDGLQSYAAFLEGAGAQANRFAAVFSRILEVNTIARASPL